MDVYFFFFKQKTAYEIGTGDWSSDVCSSDLGGHQPAMLFGSCTQGGGQLQILEILPVALSNPLLHIFFELNSLDSRKNSATSGSISLSNMPLYGRRTSSTCWIVLCVTNGFHSFLRQHCLPGHQFKQGVIDLLG